MSIPPWVTELFSRGGYLDGEGRLRKRRLVFHTLALMLFVFALYWGAYQIYRAMGWNHLAAISEFVEDLGVGGVALYVFIVDLLIMPLSVDLIWPFVISWPMAKAVLVIGSASMAAALVSHLIGRLIGLIPLLRGWVTSVIGGETKRLVNRYGAWAIVISGLTPLPFSTITLASGVLHLTFSRVALASTVRFFRMAIYYLIVTRLIF